MIYRVMENNNLKKLKKYLPQGKTLLEKKAVLDIIFSEKSYEVEVKDGDKTYWPFLQVEDGGELKDCFCSCEDQEKTGLCSHIAAAYLKIIANDIPIHYLFKKSFIRALFYVIAEKVDYQFNAVSYRENIVKISDSRQKIAEVNLSLKNIKKIKSIIASNKNKENIEGTLKFSSLSFEEIENFKKGKIEEKAKFELSVYSDLAKEIFLKSCDKNPSLTFSSIDELPKEAVFSFSKENTIKAKLIKNDWKKLIEPLTTMKSPLKVYNFENFAISNVYVDSKKKSVVISKDNLFLQEYEKIKREEKEIVDSFIFAPRKGFYPINKPSFLQKNEISKKDIPSFIAKNGYWFEKFFKIDNEEKKVKYEIEIDLYSNLHVFSYLFEKDDFQKEGNFICKPYAYFKDKGFILLDNPLFERGGIIYRKEKVPEFVSHYKAFLQEMKGFETHVGNFSEKLSYYFNKKGDLQFDTQITNLEGLNNRFIDFGMWLYIEGKGFYSKKEKGAYPIDPYKVVRKEDIGSFILENKNDLEEMQGFFIFDSPVEKIGIDVIFEKDELIKLVPEIVYSENVSPHEVTFYGDVVYLKDKGFYILPSSMNVPYEYQKEKIIEKKDIEFFLSFELGRLEHCIVNIDKRLKKPKRLNAKLEFLKPDRKSYLLDLYYVSELGKVSAYDIYLNLQVKNKKYFFSRAGLLDLSDVRFNWIKELEAKNISEKKKMFKISYLQWLKLSVFEEIKKPRKNKTKKEKETQNTYNLLTNLSIDKTYDLKLLKSSLWPYQLTGFKWLYFLYSFGLSGLLCDEMGLGKTHQAMALLAAIKQEKKNKKSKYLIICPTSVIYHWEDQLERFLPDFKVSVFHGHERVLPDEYDILLTSYGIARKEMKLISKIKFDLTVFDEIQIAKNYASKTYKALKRIKSKMSLGLTGTPLENKVKELKAIFDLVLPNFLPGEKKFKTLFLDPIEKENSKEKKVMLTNLLKPFMLRRKKKEVLSELPEKIEELSYVELLEDQKELYLETIYGSRDKIIKNLEDENVKINYMHIFSLLTKLKQICDHPAIVLKDISNFEKYSSGKWELFKELIKEVLESNQKVVVFSQYLDMLKIMEMYLKKENIEYGKIVGETVDRRGQIEKFKNEPSCKVFLASLLAAGVGIDLTAASIVIHYDRWWNPAKENQATDRVHRIGQNRGVQVFKLITKETIEERIHSIIESKKSLFEELILTDDSSDIKMLSRKELIEIFKEIKKQ